MLQRQQQQEQDKQDKIIEVSCMHDSLPYIKFFSHLILDLDNTVIEPFNVIIGSDQWFTKLLEEASHLQVPMTSVFSIYQAVQHQLSMQPVELSIVKLIKYLQDIGIPVIALTSRDQALKETTERQLREIGIDFHGKIVFCSGQHKGRCLALYYAANYSALPTHLTVLDDKKKHLQHVIEEMEARNVIVTALRYGYLDDWVKQCDMQVANLELSRMKHRLPPSTYTIMQQLGLDSYTTSQKDKVLEQVIQKDSVESVSIDATPSMRDSDQAETQSLVIR